MKILNFFKSHKSIACVLLFSLVLCGVNSTICRAEQYLVGSYNADGDPVQLTVPTATQPLKAVLATAANQTYQTQGLTAPYADGRSLLDALVDLGLDDEFSTPINELDFYVNYCYFTYNNYYYYCLIFNKSSCFADDYELDGISGEQGYYNKPFTSILSFTSTLVGSFITPYAHYLTSFLTFNRPYLISPSSSYLGSGLTYYDWGGGNLITNNRFGLDKGFYYYNHSLVPAYYSPSGSNFVRLDNSSDFLSLFLSDNTATIGYLFYTTDIGENGIYFKPLSAFFGTDVKPNLRTSVSSVSVYSYIPLASTFRDFYVNSSYFTLDISNSNFQYRLIAGGQNGLDLERVPLVPWSYSLLSTDYVGPRPTLTPTPFPTYAPWEPDNPAGGSTPTPAPTDPWRDSSLPTPTPFPSYVVPSVSVTPIPQYLNPDSPISSDDAIGGLSGYLNIIDSTFGNFDIFFIGSQILTYFYNFSPYFSFVLLIPAICLIAFVIGRLNQK